MLTVLKHDAPWTGACGKLRPHPFQIFPATCIEPASVYLLPILPTLHTQCPSPPGRPLVYNRRCNRTSHDLYRRTVFAALVAFPQTNPIPDDSQFAPPCIGRHAPPRRTWFGVIRTQQLDVQSLDQVLQTKPHGPTSKVYDAVLRKDIA